MLIERNLPLAKRFRFFAILSFLGLILVEHAIFDTTHKANSGAVHRLCGRTIGSTKCVMIDDLHLHLHYGLLAVTVALVVGALVVAPPRGRS